MVEISSSYNLVWMSPRFYKSGQEEIRQPVQNATMDNISNIAKKNADTEVKFWTDSLRMAPSQLNWLEESFKQCPTHNLGLHDLRSIEAFNAEPFYSQEDTFANWRCHKDSLIWRQVDSVRILAILQGNYTQTFYSDTDITNLVISSPEVQKPMKKYGLVIGGGGAEGGCSAWYENQLFGFDSRQRPFFRALYQKTLQRAIHEKRNGYGVFVDSIKKELNPSLSPRGRNGFLFRAKFDKTEASHPGKEYLLNEVLFPTVLTSGK
ncbi:hypothetical protein KA107_03715 [Candidatus Pacearchaeota archaeon]|nr:hypothetical protein [Candidatus Pacearchaeota archaeon]